MTETARTQLTGATDVFPSALWPFAPILHVVWADGALSAAEIEAVRTVLEPHLDDAGRAALRPWLDPASPPSAERVAALRDTIRGAVGAKPPATLAALGEHLARQAGADDSRVRAVREALMDAEVQLAMAGGEAVRSVLPHPPAVEEARPAPPFDVAALRALLEAPHADLRRRVLSLLSGPEFAYTAVHETGPYRERVLAWCRRLAEEGIGALAYPREFGGEHDASKQIAAFQAIAFHDLSLLVKFGVQFGLFGGSIFLLGTRRHHERWLRAAGTLELPGCFAMTETNHGSNVRDLETTATYSPETREFTIHTPNAGAVKDYIGNAALHGRMAVVFAQLETAGRRHGVHAFLVPIRDEAGRALPGITIEDCGRKAGLNGVDNGRIRFDRVRIPRENLLDRFGEVAEDGSYSSPIASDGRRFFTMLGTLVAGRIAIASAAVSAAESGLTIAVRYTDQRRQFGAEGEPESPVLDYLAMQRALLPRLAGTFAVHFAMRDLVSRFVHRSEADAQEVEALAAGLKAWASRHAVDTLQVCREACGGAGYMEENRLSILRADTDVFTTFEGANAVLLQLVARARLTEYREQFGELRLWNVVRRLSGMAASAVAERNPIATRRTDPDHLRDPEFHEAAFRFREERLLGGLARRLRRRIRDGENSFDALNACQDHAIALATAATERFILERFHAHIRAVADSGLQAVLTQLAALFALSRLEAESGWFLEKGYLEAPKAAAIREEVNTLCREVRGHARALVDAFGIPDVLLAAPIATAARRPGGPVA